VRGTFAIHVVGGVSGINEDEVRMDVEPLLDGLHVGIGENLLVPDQAAGSVLCPCSDDEKQVIQLAIDREDAQRAHGRLAGRNDAPCCIDARLAVPYFPLEIAAWNDLQLVVLKILAPCQRQTLLIELLDERHITTAGGCLGAKI